MTSLLDSRTSKTKNNSSSFYLDIDKVRVGVSEYGQNNRIAIVFFPPWTKSLEDSEPFLMSLSTQFHVYSIHYPGYLNSISSSKSENPSFFNEIIRAILSNNKIENPIFIGVSLGAQILNNYYQNKEIKNKLILIGCPVFPLKDSAPIYAKPIISFSIVSKIIRKIYIIKKILVDIGYKNAQGLTKTNTNLIDFIPSERCTLNGAYDSLISALRFENKLNLNSVKCMLLYGENDKFYDDALTQNLNPKVIRGGSHVPYYKNCQETFELINQFIKHE